MQRIDETPRQQLDRERSQALRQLEHWLETPMILLGFAWLALLITELIWGLSELLEYVTRVIWISFIVEFGARFTLAPRKLRFLRKNVLTLFALALPAVRVFRIFRTLRALRLARVSRGLRLLRLVTSLNRGMKALSSTMARRGLGYVVALTAVVTLAGAAGMYAFEKEVPGGLSSYGTALWWTAMLLTSIASEYWPQTAEGRVLCLLLSVYGFAVFGYMTASLASFFIGRDAADEQGEVASAESIRDLQRQLEDMRREIRALLRNPS